jgi:hypothetical protein
MQSVHRSKSRKRGEKKLRRDKRFYNADETQRNRARKRKSRRSRPSRLRKSSKSKSQESSGGRAQLSLDQHWEERSRPLNLRPGSARRRANQGGVAPHRSGSAVA